MNIKCQKPVFEYNKENRKKYRDYVEGAKECNNIKILCGYSGECSAPTSWCEDVFNFKK